jgi:hypothetical protein
MKNAEYLKYYYISEMNLSSRVDMWIRWTVTYTGLWPLSAAELRHRHRERGVMHVEAENMVWRILVTQD